jgi:hypothetical protein
VKRLLWLGVGVAVGAIVVYRVSKAVKAYSPSGLAASARDSAVGFVDTMRDFVADVRDGMAEREAQLHAAFDQGITFDEALSDPAALDQLTDEEYRTR